MWNKLLLVVLFLIFGISFVFSQEFLGKTSIEIEHFFDGNRKNVLQRARTIDTLQFTYSEEDERNRRFEILYSFYLTQDTCKRYEKKVPLHEYYANQIKEGATMKKAEGCGNALKVDGETLYSVYRFEKYILLLRIENDWLVLTFQMP